MSQHDNGRRAAGHQAGPWQQGDQGHQGYGQGQHEQSGQYGGQQGGHRDGGNDWGGHRGHQDQFDANRGQQGDQWGGPSRGAGSARYSPDDRQRDWPTSRSGQGSFGGQASDNDYGNRGVTESGNFGNYDAGRQGGGSTWNRSAADRGYGSERDYRDYRDNSRYGADQHRYGAAGQDRGGWQDGPSNQDRYGDGGYQGNWQQGRQSQSYHDPDYHQWRGEQMRRLDQDYDEWRQHRYQRFSDEFNDWRNQRDQNRGGQDAGAGAASRASGNVGASASTEAPSGKASDKSHTK